MNLFFLILLLGNATWSHVGLQNSSDPAIDEVDLDQLIKSNGLTELDSVGRFLPETLRLNFVLKHGIKRDGERGHLNEEKVSQSADPELPRAILWNESTGFSVSYNGGGAKQTANQRLDILSYSKTNHQFQLSAVDFPLTEEQVRGSHSVVKADVSCQECHGPHQRPIFAMYPDWPAFYGSDNDELNNEHVATQQAELSDYEKFRTSTAVSNPRYSFLYHEDLVMRAYGRGVWPTYPYRPDTSTEVRNTSRSFSFRPGLRLGIVYNRLNADMVFAQIKNHANYAKYATLALHSLLQCDWDPAYTKTLAAMKDLTARALSSKVQWIKPEGLQLHYHQIWNLFGLKINDVDIRYSYNHKAYQNINATGKVMATGYMGKYFNSYFDGTATIDELVAAKILNDLAQTSPRLQSSYRLHGLVEKYRHLTERFRFDEALFKNYDGLGLWFPIPYAKEVFEPQHRETYTAEMKAQHQAVCKQTILMLKDQVSKF